MSPRAGGVAPPVPAIAVEPAAAIEPPNALEPPTATEPPLALVPAEAFEPPAALEPPAPLAPPPSSPSSQHPTRAVARNGTTSRLIHLHRIERNAPTRDKSDPFKEAHVISTPQL